MKRLETSWTIQISERNSAIIWRDCAVYMSENVMIQVVYEGGVFKPLQDTNRIFDEALSIALETGSRAADSFYIAAVKVEVAILIYKRFLYF